MHTTSVIITDADSQRLFQLPAHEAGDLFKKLLRKSSDRTIILISHIKDSDWLFTSLPKDAAKMLDESVIEVINLGGPQWPTP